MPPRPDAPSGRSTSPRWGEERDAYAAGIAAPELEKPTPAANPEARLPEDFGPGAAGRLLFWIAVAFAAFQIVTAFGIPINRNLGLGITLIHLTAAGFLVWAGGIVYRGIRGQRVAEPLLALAPLLVSFLILARFGGGMPSQVLRTV